MYTIKRSEKRRIERRKRIQRSRDRHRTLCSVCTILAAGMLILLSFMTKSVLAATGRPEMTAGTDKMEGNETAAQEAYPEAERAEQDTGTADAGTKRSAEETRKKEEQESESGAGEEEGEALLIAVDAGHGGMDSGCRGKGVTEGEINLQIAFLVKRKLEEKGFRVMMPRQNDEFLSKEERVELANSYQADAYVSIHQNTYEGSDKSVSGIETWYDGADKSRDNRRLAQLIHRETLGCSGARERGLIDSAELYVVSKTLMPACLIETGFLSNPQECADLSASAYQERIAEGIAEGIYQYFYLEEAEVSYQEAFF